MGFFLFFIGFWGGGGVGAGGAAERGGAEIACSYPTLDIVFASVLFRHVYMPPHMTTVTKCYTLLTRPNTMRYLNAARQDT